MSQKKSPKDQQKLRIWRKGEKSASDSENVTENKNKRTKCRRKLKKKIPLKMDKNKGYGAKGKRQPVIER